MMFFSCCGITKDYGESAFISFEEPSIADESVYNQPELEKTMHAKYVDITYHLTGGKLMKKSSPVGDFYFLHIPGMGKLGKEGAPALPMRNNLIEIPLDAKPHIEILELESVSFDNLLIYPAQPLPSDVYGAEPPAFTFNKQYYESSLPFPTPLVEVYSDQRARDKRYLRVITCVAQQIGAKKRLKVYSKIKYRIHYY
ncbi:hypothetical protein K4L44_09175 [Halosquirtibacter laminarini]|uniref:Uncharacterized protein n=1 Tax=Halosquirtibacter laminarini TaxID=3374600 RepID=A0AC61NBC4_9BACT|nr:hypothetical protein K4L44_09175 [Prolixibacteraceae bacterium]